MSEVDLDELAQRVESADQTLAQQARDRQARLLRPAGAFGRLEEVAAWAATVQGSCPPRPFARPRVVVLAADHGVARRGVSANPPETTARLVRSIVAGGGLVNVLAARAGASVRVVDLAVDADLEDLPVIGHKVRRGSDDLAVGPALSRDEADRALRAGMAIVDEEVDAGADLLVAADLGVGATTPAATLTALLTGSDVAPMVGRGSGIDDRTWMIKCAAVRDSARRGRELLPDPIGLLAEAGGVDLAATTGFLVQAALRRTPVLLDGVVSTAAALLAHRISFRSRGWWLAGHRSPDPAHERALERLQLEPVLDFGIRLGTGTGALLALPVVQAAIAVLADLEPVDLSAATGPA
ncbi:MAG TPA: nicotinate-nucleotide--dimethylbenzimidazole phosphoribosyltransferase [Actinomycetes bacterium]